MDCGGAPEQAGADRNDEPSVSSSHAVPRRASGMAAPAASGSSPPEAAMLFARQLGARGLQTPVLTT
jgi:hypothetical protein